MVWVGVLIVLLAMGAIMRRYEPRLVLLLAGLAMALLARHPEAAFDAFSAAMANDGLVPVICTVMGFAWVTRRAGHDAHLAILASGLLTKLGPLLIPVAVLATFAINIALPSAAGCAAAAGAIFIPLLMSSGVHPAIAASAVLAGTWGSAFNPVNLHNPFIARLAGLDVTAVIAGHAAAALAGAAAVAAALAVVALLRKENRGYEFSLSETEEPIERPSLLRAAVPLTPLVILLAGSRQVGLLPEVGIPQAMLGGVFMAFAATLRQPQEFSRQFFDGMGVAYANVIGILAAVAVFTTGMELIGVSGAFIEAIKLSPQLAKLTATFGPFTIAVISGSGDAATLAFNGTVAPYAGQLGLEVSQVGSQAFLAGALGRSMSPLAGAAIVCAALAGVNPVEVAKRNAPGMIIAAAVTMLFLI